MTNLNDISNAAKDPDLRERFFSAAAEAGIPDPEAWVISNSRKLASAYVAQGNGVDTIASVYAYAADHRAMAPGLDPSAVTDEYIRFVVNQYSGLS